jgi:hypothetical protein
LSGELPKQGGRRASDDRFLIVIILLAIYFYRNEYFDPFSSVPNVSGFPPFVSLPSVFIRVHPWLITPNFPASPSFTPYPSPSVANPLRIPSIPHSVNPRRSICRSNPEHQPHCPQDAPARMEESACHSIPRRAPAPPCASSSGRRRWWGSWRSCSTLRAMTGSASGIAMSRGMPRVRARCAQAATLCTPRSTASPATTSRC